MAEPTALSVVTQFLDRIEGRDRSAIDDLLATDLVNHASPLQGREGWRAILAMIEHDLADLEVERHHLFGDGDGDMVAHHTTLHGTHVASTMPLLGGIAASGTRVSWTFMHLWRVADGQIVEHWATRDDLGVLRKLEARHTLEA
ncbi:ester cyclase [Ornithinimicrobium cerasi]|uniref:Lactoylglutathione lyase n=1 Tax=Ornithinimicrobium cerasi TaxID=2248773 RepID=A0A285VEW7_9MICO|nr:ester cyclase [Ornithinimicrobium cerasi]SOC52513.1 lactoylglutathione lyase [Ornithinimicrobium cerasi]